MGEKSLRFISAANSYNYASGKKKKKKKGGGEEMGPDLIR